MTINTQKLLSLFDTAAQAHGWTSDQGTRAQAQTALTNYQRARKDLEQALGAQTAEIARLREAAKMLADWAEHEVGAEPDLTPGLAEVRARRAAPVAQEPVARVNDEGFIVETGIPLAPGTKLYTSAPVAAQVQPTMPALTDAMRAVLRNEHDVYLTEDALYAALCDATQAQSPGNPGELDAQDREGT